MIDCIYEIWKVIDILDNVISSCVPIKGMLILVTVNYINQHILHFTMHCFAIAPGVTTVLLMDAIELNVTESI